MSPHPYDILFPYQRRWAEDASQFKIWLASRRIGKSLSATAEIVPDAWAKPKNDWLIAAASMRQATELAEKAKDWCAAFRLAIDDYQERAEIDGMEDYATLIKFPNRSRIITLPASPDTIRGFGGNVLWDEAAFTNRAREVYRALSPMIANAIRGKLKMRVLSSANGPPASNFFAQLYTSAGPEWVRYKTTAADAIAEGLPLDIDALRMVDPEGARSEYDCEFVDAAGTLLPDELLAKIALPPESILRSRAELGVGDFVAGLDFGRFSHLTCLWVLECVAQSAAGSLWITRAVECWRNQNTVVQAALLAPWMKFIKLLCLDSTGPGVGLADIMERAYGLYDPAKHLWGKIQRVTFTRNVILSIYPALRAAAEAGYLRIPHDADIFADLSGIRRALTPTGQITYVAPDTSSLPGGGHADRGTGLALAWKAAQQITPGNCAMQAVPRSPAADLPPWHGHELSGRAVVI